MGSMMAPTVVGTPSRGSTLVAGMAMYSANAPSRSTPMMRVFLQMWLLPVRHWRQWPHTICPSAVTSWPGVSSATPSPAATISPANSWPTTSGGLIRPSAHASQSAMWTSVPHTPACRTAMSTSPGPGDGLGTVVTLRPGARFSFTIACIEAGKGETGKGKRSKNGSCESPVHLQHGAGNIAGPLGREERDRRGELVGAAHAAERNGRDHVAHDLLRRPRLALRAALRELRDPLRRDEAGTHDVDGDPLGGDLVGQGLREPQNAGARGGGEDESRQRLFGGDRRETDNAAPLEFPHDGDCGASEMNRRQEVQLHGAVKRLGRLLRERCRGRTAGVAEQHVETAPLVVHPLHETFGLRRVAHVGHERHHRLGRLGGKLLRRVLHGGLVAAVDGHAGALVCQRLRYGAPQPLRAPAYQGDAARQTQVHGREFTGDGLPWLAVGAQHAAPLPVGQSATATCAGSNRTAQHLSSAIFAYGSSTGLVSRLAAASRKWNGTNTWPRATRSEIRQELTMVLRREVSRTRSPSSSPSSRASSGWISTVGVGSRWSSPDARRVMVPVCQ